MDKPLVNRVANSAIKTINLENFYPEHHIVNIDIKTFLFHELILREKEFRATLADMDWSLYQDKVVAIYCSNDAIIPTWAYMLIGSYLADVTPYVYFGSESLAIEKYYEEKIKEFDITPYTNIPVVLKGCSKFPVPESAYMALTIKLKSVARSILFGEPCSTVPIFKKPRK